MAWTLSHFSISSSAVINDVGEGRQREKMRHLVLCSKLRTFKGRVGKRTFLTLQPAKLFDLTTGNQTTWRRRSERTKCTLIYFSAGFSLEGIAPSNEPMVMSKVFLLYRLLVYSRDE